jgi:cyclic 2,3-diphosphoglycerate synthetase
VDGEHHPPVVRAAIDHLPSLVLGCEVVAAAVVGGGEKLDAGTAPDLGVPVVGGEDPDDALTKALERFQPHLVVDLSDEPVLDARTRMRLAARTLAVGVTYRGADFVFEPPQKSRLASKPSVAVIGTGKRTGKTAAACQLARLLAERGTPPVIVTMGRGGPAEPELVDPAQVDLSPAGLLSMVDTGRHAASDHLEDALVAGVASIGTRRCGGGLAGVPADSTFVAGVALANMRPETLILFEGSGAAIPPVHADATLCVVPAVADPELVTGYLGAYRLLLSDLIVVTMAEVPFAGSGAAVSRQSVSSRARAALLETRIRRLAPGVPIVHVVLRPFPLEPIAGRRVFYVTTASASATRLMASHLEREHGCKIVGTSHHLAHRAELAADLENLEGADLVVVELKAAAVDLVVRVALERDLDITFCDNRIVTIGGDGTYDELGRQVADLAVERHAR